VFILVIRECVNIAASAFAVEVCGISGRQSDSI
jgi:hypothetical protein